MTNLNKNNGLQSGRMYHHRLWLPAFMMGGISILSGSAGIQTGGWTFVGMDKLGHLVVFGLLGIAWARCYHPSVGRFYRILAGVLFTTAFGLADEAHQYHNPLRTFEWADLAADAAGATMGTLLYLYHRRLRHLLEVDFGRLLRLRFAGNRPK